MLSVRQIMIRQYSIVVAAMCLTACGPAIIKRQTYHAEPYDAYQDGERKVFIGISATREVNSNLPLFYSDIEGKPYKLFVLAHSGSDDSGKLSVLSAKAIFPDSGTVDLVSEDSKSSCQLAISESNDTFNDCYVFLPFGDILDFKPNYQFTVEAQFKLSVSDEIHTITVVMKSVESVDNGTTFDVMMSV